MNRRPCLGDEADGVLAVLQGQLHLRSPRLEVPGLVLVVVVLQAERAARLDEQDLSDVVVRMRPDELVAPGLLHAAWHIAELRHRFQPPAATRWSSACRSCFGVFTV